MSDPVNIGSRLELFVDRLLVESLKNATFKLHPPHPAPLAASPVRGGYMTVLQDRGKYQAYYRQYDPAYTGEKRDGNRGEMTCYAESDDGHEWSFPELGLCEVNGSRQNNAILVDRPPFCHNFAPFVDRNPDASPEARYKALAGTHAGGRGGLCAFHSPDGLRWEMTRDTPVITEENFAFDSQNVSFWSEAEGQYVCYYRTWRTSHGKLRTVSRRTSPDYLHWDPPVDLDPNLPGEQLYTSQTHPYFRAPHIYVALPTRFMHGSIAGEAAIGENGKVLNIGSTDILFMATRAGASSYERVFTEAFIRPGLDPERWENRANYVACGVVPTGPAEMSIYNSVSGRRFVLRTDGFISINAGSEEGESLTRALTFTGRKLVLNCSTAAAGSLGVELQTEGRPVPGFGVEDCRPIVGDSIEHVVSWKAGDDVSPLAGKPVRLRFVMKEADLFSLRFRS